MECRIGTADNVARTLWRYCYRSRVFPGREDCCFRKWRQYDQIVEYRVGERGRRGDKVTRRAYGVDNVTRIFARWQYAGLWKRGQKDQIMECEIGRAHQDARGPR